MSTTSFPKEKIKVLLLEGIHPSAKDVFTSAGYSHVELMPGSLPGDALLEKISDVHFVGIRSRTHLTAEVFEAAKKLVGVGCFCIGTNQVDLKAAEEKAVAVFNAPFSNTRSVAELVLAEAIFLLRGLPAKNAGAHRGEWLKTASGANEVRGKVLGIVGYGHIGTQVSVLAEALGMQVVFYDIVHKLAMGNAASVSSLQSLLAQSDIVTLHVPETLETQWMIGESELGQMKDGAVLINASRGSVVDIEALVTALKSERVRGAAIDVYPKEPKSLQETFSSPLQGFDNVILTPHVGGSTQEAQESIGEEVAHKLVRYSDNGSTITAVNFPQVALPEHTGKHRILHVHHNVPGVMAQINEVFASNGINVAAQFLQTTPDIGYVVIDVGENYSQLALDKLREVDSTIRCRLLR